MMMRLSRAAVLILVLVPVAHAEDEKKDDAPRTEQSRLDALERRIAEQQKEIDALKKGIDVGSVSSAAATAEKLKAAPEKADGDKIELKFDDGFVIKGRIRDTAYEIRPKGRIHLDYRVFPYSSANKLINKAAEEDRFLVRRARVGFAGKFGVFDFFFEVSPDRSPSLPLGDFYVQWSQFPVFKLRFGHYKVFFGLEDGMTGDNHIDFVERAMPIGSGAVIAPNFRLGVMALGEFMDKTIQYWVGATNQDDLNTVTTGDPMTNARIQVAAQGFAVGTSGVWTRHGGTAADSFPGVTPGQHRFFDPVKIRGWDQRYGADVSYYTGPFWIALEYAYAHQERLRVLQNNVDGTPLVTQGGYATVGWLFWAPDGDAETPITEPLAGWKLFNMDAVRRRNTRNVGLEAALRFEWVAIDDERGGRRTNGQNQVVDPSSSATASKVRAAGAKALLFGLNFTPIPNVKFMFNYARVHTDDQARSIRPHNRASDEFLFRAQCEF